jgi:hypothetical protein
MGRRPHCPGAPVALRQLPGVLSTLPGVPTRLYEFSRNVAMIPVWLVYADSSRCGVSSYNGVAPAAAVDPQSPWCPEQAGCYVYGSRVRRRDGRRCWCSCGLVKWVNGHDCPGGEVASLVRRCSALLVGVYVQVSVSTNGPSQEPPSLACSQSQKGSPAEDRASWRTHQRQNNININSRGGTEHIAQLVAQIYSLKVSVTMSTNEPFYLRY